jgi:hypothetical protein
MPNLIWQRVVDLIHRIHVLPKIDEGGHDQEKGHTSEKALPVDQFLESRH